VEINSKSYTFPVAERTKTQLPCNSAFIPDVLREQESGIWNILVPSQRRRTVGEDRDTSH